MNDDQPIITTAEGLEDLKKELEDRKTLVREKIANEISKAREQGDLSENASYTNAMEQKDFNENRITQLEKMISNAVVKVKDSSDKKAGIGETVKLKRLGDDKEFSYKLVGENEANPSEGKISIKSPIGSKLLNKKIGDEVEINLPTGVQKYKLLKID